MEILRPRYETHIAQDEAEIEALVALLRQEKVTSYLEIGARYGGSLWRIARALPQGSRVVAVDLPDGPGGKAGAIFALRACVGELRRVGYDARLIEGDSQQPSVVEKVETLGPYDCVFIDGDHTLEGIRLDWKNYGRMAKLVAFHDIACSNPEKPIKALVFWERIKTGYRHREFKYHHTGRHNGIGVLWNDSKL
jgi:cephalosporin hydroxylase